MATTLTLDRAHIIQLLIRPDFYKACPAFAYLEACAVETHTRYLVDKSDGVSVCCGKNWGYYRGLIDAFFLKVKELKAAGDVAAFVALKDYLAAKKGYRPGSLVLYYRRSSSQGKIAKLVF